MKHIIAIAVTVCLVAAAQGDVLTGQYILTGTYGNIQHVEVFYEASVTTAAGLMDRLRVEFYTPSESQAGWIGAVDLTIEGDTGEPYQLMAYGNLTPDMYWAQVLPPDAQLQDSHFLLNPDGSPWGSHEDNDQSIGGGVGFGDLWTTNWIPKQFMQQRLPFAQVVVPTGTMAKFGHGHAGGIADGDGEVWNVDGLIIGIPEPVTLVLFAMGGLAILRKRRR